MKQMEVENEKNVDNEGNVQWSKRDTGILKSWRRQGKGLILHCARKKQFTISGFAWVF